MDTPASMVHIADVHLGLGSRDWASAEGLALSRAIDLAIVDDVDCLLIAGDLFDHPRVPAALLDWTAEQLARAGRPVVLLVGNHDALHETSVHHRFGIAERCANVHLLDDPDGSSFRPAGSPITFWGRAMIEHSPSYHPLEGLPPRPTDTWAVAVGHGLVMDDHGRRHHGSPITEAELDEIDWDYVALGHHHGHKIVRHTPVPVVYPGATARSLHGEPGAVRVDFTPGEAASVRWASLANPVLELEPVH